MTTFPPSNVKIILAWVGGGLLGTIALLGLLKPMAGLGTMILLVGALSVTVCPAIHVLAAKALFPRGAYHPWIIVLYLLFALASLYFVLGTTTMFHFT